MKPKNFQFVHGAWHSAPTGTVSSSGCRDGSSRLRDRPPRQWAQRNLSITAAAEATPDLIDRLVYLTAYVPVPDLPNAVALASLPEGQSSISGAILIGDPRVTGAQRINPRNADPDYVEKGRRALYNDVADEESTPRSPQCRTGLPKS